MHDELLLKLLALSAFGSKCMLVMLMLKKAWNSCLLFFKCWCQLDVSAQEGAGLSRSVISCQRGTARDNRGRPACSGVGSGMADDRAHLTLAALTHHATPLTASHQGRPPAPVTHCKSSTCRQNGSADTGMYAM